MIHSLIPDSIHPPFGNYAQGVKIVAPKQIVTTSGQLGISKDGATPSDIESQARICFGNIETILESAELAIEDIVQLRTFVTAREYFQPYMAVRDEFLKGKSVASTLMIVSGFTRPEFKVEIEALAMR